MGCTSLQLRRFEPHQVSRRNDVFPAQPGVHNMYSTSYPACYSGQSPWNTVGPDLPYTDN
ncbi:hypothetical protein DAT35_38555 [Vitiosangium sp. GDMCC 1.1324]|nr:hypothetical protein DAT35_38555 [Vitiosangium sp. GDMCC 1.1324]